MSVMSTFRLLKKEQPDRIKVLKKFAKRSDDQLLGAIANPEHSDTAKAILTEIANDRGLETGGEWLLLEKNMYVKPFGMRPTVDEAMQAPAKRRRQYRALQWFGVLSWLVAGALLVSEGLPGIAYEVATLLIPIGPVVWYLGAIYSWQSPARILLLRPFQSRKLSRALNKFNSKNLVFHGHITTLADQHMKESRLMFLNAWIPRSPWEFVFVLLFLIPAVRQLLRWLEVTSASSYSLLKNRQSRRFTLNFFWVNAFNKVLKVRCSDTWWQQAVDLLMFSSQLIVVDLSLVKVGTEWELNKINDRDLERKTVFIVAESEQIYALEVVKKFWPSEEVPPPLYVYDKKGNLIDAVGFNRYVAEIISNSHLWDEQASASYRTAGISQSI